MQIVFPGPDGQTLTVADPRPDAKSGKKATVVITPDHRPAGWLLTNFRL